MAERDVQVLLSTYNGVRHLPEQLASLSRQTIARRVKLLVRDDGSTDETIELLRAWDPGPLEVDIRTGANVGAVASFGKLMAMADQNAKVFMLCDQDDIWL
ncbi:MAG: glycosyltransferase, partial [Propionibacteriaceae bacterium]|nr:glycosyltransferase [Propionibacteriaceae bacterium]